MDPKHRKTMLDLINDLDEFKKKEEKVLSEI